MRSRRALPVLFLFVFAASCGGGSDGVVPGAVPPGWRAALEAERAATQAFFAGADSPLFPETRASFTGLSFFPPDSTFRFVVRLDARGRGQAAPILDNKGELRRYRVEGKFHLRHEGEPFTLLLFRSVDDGTFFLPFQDATSGAETYGMGRYVEVEPEEDGLFLVDLNRAYNPYCAYEPRWACPLVPPENRVSVAIRAGQKTTPAH